MKHMVVQLHDKNGVRVEKVPFKQAGFTIGRAWSSDIILQDKYVDPEHLKFTLGDDGVVLVADLATTNGSSSAGKRLHGDPKPYRFGDPIKVGDTTLRVFHPSVGVAPTSLRSGWYLLSEKFNSGLTIVALTLMALAVTILMDWLFSVKPLDVGDLLTSVFGLLVVMIVSILILGFIAKLIKGESGLRSWWVLGCLSIILLNVVSVVLMIVRFNIQNVDFSYWLSVLGFGGLAVWVMVGMFSYMSYLGTGRKWICSFVVVLSVFALIKSDQWLKEDHELWNSYSDTEQVTLPPALLFKDQVSLDEYQQDAESLFEFEELSDG